MTNYDDLYANTRQSRLALHKALQTALEIQGRLIERDACYKEFRTVDGHGFDDLAGYGHAGINSSIIAIGEAMASLSKVLL